MAQLLPLCLQAMAWLWLPPSCRLLKSRGFGVESQMGTPEAEPLIFFEGWVSQVFLRGGGVTPLSGGGTYKPICLRYGAYTVLLKPAAQKIRELPVAKLGKSDARASAKGLQRSTKKGCPLLSETVLFSCPILPRRIFSAESISLANPPVTPSPAFALLQLEPALACGTLGVSPEIPALA